MTSPSALLLNGDSRESGTKFLGSRRLHHFFQVLYNHCEPHCATRILTDFYFILFYFFWGRGGCIQFDVGRVHHGQQPAPCVNMQHLQYACVSSATRSASRKQQI